MNKKILLIEDEEDLAIATQFYLQRLGFFVRHCVSGAEGLAMLRSQKWDCLLIDWMLPDISGIDVLHKIKRKAPAVIFMISAKDSHADIEEALQAGVQVYISKPFSLEALRVRLERAFERLETTTA